MTQIHEGRRFYVWQEGWKVCSAWYAAPPRHPHTDCTGMDDEEFDAFMTELYQLEHNNTSPGHPGDPGRF